MACNLGQAHVDHVSAGALMSGLFEAMHAQGLELAAGIEVSNALPNHYQDLLPEFLANVRPGLIVETGAATGISTDRILSTLDRNDRGVLYSVDPDPCAVLFDIMHPRWLPRRKFSQDALADIFLESGAWDVFLHDSDHGVWCQTFEYEVAWHFVKDRGYILSDDISWGNPPHHAWDLFCERHSLSPWKLGNASVVRKPFRSDKLEQTNEVIQRAMSLADAACITYRQVPGASDQIGGGVSNGRSNVQVQP